MKLTKVLKITYVLVLAVLIVWISSCKYDETNPAGEMVNYGKCKQKQSNSKNIGRDSSTECIDYTTNAGSGTLLIKHVNRFQLLSWQNIHKYKY